MSLPLVLENIVGDYVSQIEHTNNMKKVSEQINSISYVINEYDPEDEATISNRIFNNTHTTYRTNDLHMSLETETETRSAYTYQCCNNNKIDHYTIHDRITDITFNWDTGHLFSFQQAIMIWMRIKEFQV